MSEVEQFLKNHDACQDGCRFALRFETMLEVWSALMRGEPNKEKARAWALWIVSRDSVLPKRERVGLAVKFAERVKHLMEDQRSIDALEVAKRYAEGNATDEELKQAYDDVVDSADAASAYVVYASADAASACSARDSERAAQMEILLSIKNPFAEKEQS